MQDLLDDQGKENMNLVNRMKEYKDPLLDAFDEEQNKKSTKIAKRMFWSKKLVFFFSV